MRIALTCILLSLIPLVAGCTFGGNSAPAHGPIEPGHYPPPPVGVLRPRVAVTPFHVTTDQGFTKTLDLSDAAADEMMKLLDGTARFNLIERVRLTQMLREQNLIDVLEPGEWSRPAALPGVSYLMIGRVLNLSVTADDPAAKFGMSKMKQWVGMGEDKNGRVNVTVTCNVDVRLVDPASGTPRVDVPRAFRKTASAAAWGLNLAADRDLSALSIRQDEAQGLLRLILDDEIRQMLPQVDATLVADTTAAAASPARTAQSPPLPAQPAPISAHGGPQTMPALLRRICPECGADVSVYDEFCPNCGARLPRADHPAASQPIH